MSNICAILISLIAVPKGGSALVKLRTMPTIYERINAAAEQISAERRAQADQWWQNRRLWANHETWRSETEAEAFENLLEACPRQPGDPYTRSERSEHAHLMHTVVSAVLKEMRDVPAPRRRRRKPKWKPLSTRKPREGGSNRD